MTVTEKKLNEMHQEDRSNVNEPKDTKGKKIEGSTRIKREEKKIVEKEKQKGEGDEKKETKGGDISGKTETKDEKVQENQDDKEVNDEKKLEENLADKKGEAGTAKDEKSEEKQGEKQEDDNKEKKEKDGKKEEKEKEKENSETNEKHNKKTSENTERTNESSDRKSENDKEIVAKNEHKPNDQGNVVEKNKETKDEKPTKFSKESKQDNKKPNESQNTQKNHEKQPNKEKSPKNDKTQVIESKLIEKGITKGDAKSDLSASHVESSSVIEYTAFTHLLIFLHSRELTLVLIAWFIFGILTVAFLYTLNLKRFIYHVACVLCSVLVVAGIGHSFGYLTGIMHIALIIYFNYITIPIDLFGHGILAEAFPITLKAFSIAAVACIEHFVHIVIIGLYMTSWFNDSIVMFMIFVGFLTHEIATNLPQKNDLSLGEARDEYQRINLMFFGSAKMTGQHERI